MVGLSELLGSRNSANHNVSRAAPAQHPERPALFTCATAPTPEQAEALKAIMLAYNGACNFVSALAWKKHVFNQIALHHMTYRDIRAQFHLPSQLAVRAIAKVAAAYKANKTVKAEF